MKWKWNEMKWDKDEMKWNEIKMKWSEDKISKGIYFSVFSILWFYGDSLMVWGGGVGNELPPVPYSTPVKCQFSLPLYRGEN